MKKFKFNVRLEQVEDLFFSLQDNTAVNIKKITGLPLYKVNKYINQAVKNKTQLKSIEVKKYTLL